MTPLIPVAGAGVAALAGYFLLARPAAVKAMAPKVDVKKGTVVPPPKTVAAASSIGPNYIDGYKQGALDAKSGKPAKIPADWAGAADYEKGYADGYKAVKGAVDVLGPKEAGKVLSPDSTTSTGDPKKDSDYTYGFNDGEGDALIGQPYRIRDEWVGYEPYERGYEAGYAEGTDMAKLGSPEAKAVASDVIEGAKTGVSAATSSFDAVKGWLGFGGTSGTVAAGTGASGTASAGSGSGIDTTSAEYTYGYDAGVNDRSAGAGPRGSSSGRNPADFVGKSANYLAGYDDGMAGKSRVGVGAVPMLYAHTPHHSGWMDSVVKSSDRSSMRRW